MSDQCRYQLLSPGSAGKSEDLLADKLEDKGIRRVQALLADWLRMENVVVLTAAGCSVTAGGRLMAGPHENNLECLVLNALEKCTLSDEAKSIIGWKKANGFGSGDFEPWLSYLFGASDFTSGESSPIESVLWKDSTQLTDQDQGDLCDLIQRAIYAECALALNHAELTEDTAPLT